MCNLAMRAQHLRGGAAAFIDEAATFKDGGVPSHLAVDRISFGEFDSSGGTLLFSGDYSCMVAMPAGRTLLLISVF